MVVIDRSPEDIAAVLAARDRAVRILRGERAIPQPPSAAALRTEAMRLAEADAVLRALHPEIFEEPP